MAGNLTLEKRISSIGEEIGLELGNQMVNDYMTANPGDVQYYQIGREILEKILAQPGCAGIKFYNALNEAGEKTLVYVGMDQNGKALLELTSINTSGKLESAKGIVADRIRTGDDGPVKTSDSEDWNWTID